MPSLYTLLKADEKQIRKILVKELKDNGYSPIVNPDFIYAKGTVPVMLVAHYDTVPEQPKYINNRNGILSAKKGLGADDRAGIYGILEIIKKHHCHVLFTGGEEVGGIGARAFVNSKITPTPLNYLIQLDRRGENDAVYYDGDNSEFEDFITGFGWKTAFGSFTDICELAPALGVSAVNLSIGYQNEHTHKETLDTQVMNTNIARVCKMLDGGFYEWKEAVYYYGNYSKYGGYFDGYYASYVVFYEDTDGNVFKTVTEGTSDAEAIGIFLMEHPDLCYNDIIDYMLEEDYDEKNYI